MTSSTVTWWVDMQQMASTICNAASDLRRTACRMWFHCHRLVGHNGYQRFLVLAHARTGTNLLMSLLGSHPAVHVTGEALGKLGERRPEDVLARVYRRMPRRIKAVGFKVFYYHPLDGDPVEVRHILRQIPGLRVIHLRRRNMLRTIVSRELAMRTQRWAQKDDSDVFSGPAPGTVGLTPDELTRRFHQIRSWEEQAPAELAPAPVHELCYEHLTADRERQMRRVLEFLGVPHDEPLQTDLRRQNPQPVRELISNFDELRRAFAGGPWAGFFENHDLENPGADTPNPSAATVRPGRPAENR